MSQPSPSAARFRLEAFECHLPLFAERWHELIPNYTICTNHCTNPRRPIGVAPTFVYTEMIDHVVNDPEFKTNVIARIPLGRIADPADVVGPVQFLCAPASNFIPGQVLYVDGGLTACQ